MSDQKKEYEIRRVVAQDISGLILDKEYDTALTLLENTSDDLMEKDALYASLAMNLSQWIHVYKKDGDYGKEGMEMLEKMVDYCKSKSKILKSVVLAGMIGFYASGCSNEENIEDKVNYIQKQTVEDVQKDYGLSEMEKDVKNLEKHQKPIQDKVEKISNESNDRLDLYETFLDQDEYSDSNSKPEGYDDFLNEKIE